MTRKGQSEATPTARSCAYCDRPLPASARSWRRFCSSQCRLRSWDAENVGPDRGTDDRRDVPLHWHVQVRDYQGEPIGLPSVSGDGLTSRVRYWRGLGCPPECQHKPEAPNFSIGMRLGHEHTCEFPPDQAHLISRGSWHPTADPVDYGAPPSRRKRGGDLVRLDRVRACR